MKIGEAKINTAKTQAEKTILQTGLQGQDDIEALTQKLKDLWVDIETKRKHLEDNIKLNKKWILRIKKMN